MVVLDGPEGQLQDVLDQQGHAHAKQHPRSGRRGARPHRAEHTAQRGVGALTACGLRESFWLRLAQETMEEVGGG